MFDIMVLVAICTGISGMVFVVMYIFNSDIGISWMVGLILVIITLLLYITINIHLQAENYIIDRDIIEIEKIEFDKIDIIFSNTLDVEVMEYRFPLSSFWDYEVYRIYIDSVTYIEIRPEKYDSLDIQVGKKLFKE